MKSRPLTEDEQKVIDARRAEQEKISKAPKRFAITIEDIQEHGATDKCRGCKSALTGGHRQPHTSECRNRFEAVLDGDEKVQTSEQRANEFYAKVVQADEDKRETAKRERPGSSRDAEVLNPMTTEPQPRWIQERGRRCPTQSQWLRTRGKSPYQWILNSKR